MNLRIEDLSPTGNDVAICVGTCHIAKTYDWNSKPIAFGLKIAMKDTTDTMLIKVPVSVGKLKAKDLKEELIKNDAVGVRFKNLCIWSYNSTNKKTGEQKKVYTGIADDLEIIY